MSDTPARRAELLTVADLAVLLSAERPGTIAEPLTFVCGARPTIVLVVARQAAGGRLRRHLRVSPQFAARIRLG